MKRSERLVQQVGSHSLHDPSPVPTLVPVLTLVLVLSQLHALSRVPALPPSLVLDLVLGPSQTHNQHQNLLYRNSSSSLRCSEEKEFAQIVATPTPTRVDAHTDQDHSEMDYHVT